jgi:hypothetical protein
MNQLSVLKYDQIDDDDEDEVFNGKYSCYSSGSFHIECWIHG